MMNNEQIKALQAKADKAIAETIIRHVNVNGQKGRVSLLRVEGVLTPCVTILDEQKAVSRFLCGTEKTANGLLDVLRSAMRQGFSRGRLHHVSKVYLEPWHAKGYDHSASPRLDELTAMVD